MIKIYYNLFGLFDDKLLVDKRVYIFKIPEQ